MQRLSNFTLVTFGSHGTELETFTHPTQNMDALTIGVLLNSFSPVKSLSITTRTRIHSDPPILTLCEVEAYGGKSLREKSIDNYDYPKKKTYVNWYVVIKVSLCSYVSKTLTKFRY